ncbi:MAG: glycosyltransferase family 4 protein [Acidimicrobiales bacterium]
MSNDKLKIALVASKFPLVTQTATIKDIYELERMGHDVRIFAMEAQPWPDEIDPKALQFRDKYMDLGPKELLRNGPASLIKQVSPSMMATVARFLALATKSSDPGFRLRHYFCVAAGVHLAELAEAQGIDYFHANFGAAQAFIAWVASELSGIPYGFTTHAYDIYTEGHNNFMHDKIEHASLVTTISEFNRRHMASEFDVSADKIEVHYCGIDPESFPPRGAKLDDNGKPLILAIGSLTAQKGHENLIKALGMLKRSGVDNFETVIVGKGIPGKNSLQGPLEQLIKSEGLDDHVSMVGHVSQDELIRLLHTASVSVLACRQDAATNAVDGIPATLMEGMAVGVPTISTTVSGVPELIEDGVSGLLADPEDPATMADAIGRVINDQALQEKLSAGGYQRVLERFDITRNSQALAHRITDVVAGQSATH